jgi:PEP-CTERM motif
VDLQHQLSVSTLDINFPGVSMMNRSVFLSLAAGLLASLAFAAPSQAATQLVTSSFAGSGGTMSDIEIVFSAPITSVSVGSNNLPGFTATFSGNLLTESFTPAATGFADVVVQGAGVGTGSFTPTGLTSGFVLSSFAVTFASVPEPTSIALLGIGMTGFLAFRRFFKRTAVA